MNESYVDKRHDTTIDVVSKQYNIQNKVKLANLNKSVQSGKPKDPTQLSDYS